MIHTPRASRATTPHYGYRDGRPGPGTPADATEGLAAAWWHAV